MADRKLPPHSELEARMLKAALKARADWLLAHDRITVDKHSISIQMWLLDAIRAALLVEFASRPLPASLTAGDTPGNPLPPAGYWSYPVAPEGETP